MRRWRLIGVVGVLALSLGVGAALAVGSGGTDTLLGTQTLTAGRTLVSGDDHYELTMQPDGNLVLYLLEDGSQGRALWSSGTGDNPGAKAVLQADGDLVVRSAAGDTLWASNTSSAGCTNLVLQDDGNLVLYAPAAAVWASHTLNTGLRDGDKLMGGQRIFSIDEQYELAMQTDGNLVLYGPTGALWSSKTNGHAGAWATLQTDGNLVVYPPSGKALWASNTARHGGDDAVLQNDGNFVIYSSAGKALWASNTSATRAKGASRFQRAAFVNCPAPTPTTPTTPTIPPPVSTAPVVTVPTPTPAPTLARLRVRMTLSWTWNRGTTRLHRLTLRRLPHDATIVLSCAGRGCPRHAARGTGARLRRFLASVERHRYRAGDRLGLTISERGHRPERIGIRIRYGALPRVRVL
ncbi:MAG TPA: hypothetical protein VG223_13790 [Solirubrobacteraceae bacterium]|nr:hypothetical protein [Solirubrobacteraceae bacterium]